MLAIDVGSEDNNELTNYGDHVSGWYCLWNKINPLAKKIRVSRLVTSANVFILPRVNLCYHGSICVLLA